MVPFESLAIEKPALSFCHDATPLSRRASHWIVRRLDGLQIWAHSVRKWWSIATAWNRHCCCHAEMATCRHWSVSLWRDPDDVSHCRLLSPDKTEWRLISATLCGWRRCFVADQLWFMTRIREDEEDHVRVLGVTISSDLSLDKHVSNVCAKCFFWLR